MSTAAQQNTPIPAQPADRPVFLIGFRATGKSTVGRLVAQRIGFEFLDMDQVLIDRHGPIHRLVEEKGWPYFRRQEKQLLDELLERQRLVVATGGGAILHQDLWPRVMACGLVVWLRASEETIRARLLADRATASQRPSLTGGDTADEIGRVLEERQPLYVRGCHFSLATESATPPELADAIVHYYRQWSDNRAAPPDFQAHP